VEVIKIGKATTAAATAGGAWSARKPTPGTLSDRPALSRPWRWARVTYPRLEVIGPRMVFVTGDDTQSHATVRLRAL
jgi:hypothetical protein